MVRRGWAGAPPWAVIAIFDEAPTIEAAVVGVLACRPIIVVDVPWAPLARET